MKTIAYVLLVLVTVLVLGWRWKYERDLRRDAAAFRNARDLAMVGKPITTSGSLENAPAASSMPAREALDFTAESALKFTAQSVYACGRMGGMLDVAKRFADKFPADKIGPEDWSLLQKAINDAHCKELEDRFKIWPKGARK